MNTVGEMAENLRLHLTVRESISHYIEGFIPVHVAHHCLGGILSELDLESQNRIHWGVNELATGITIGRIMPIENDGRGRLRSLPRVVDIAEPKESPVQLQFVVVTHFVISSPRGIARILEWFRVFCQNLISIEAASAWRAAFDSKLIAFFNRWFCHVIRHHFSNRTLISSGHSNRRCSISSGSVCGFKKSGRRKHPRLTRLQFAKEK
jgi:hypothetical protein